MNSIVLSAIMSVVVLFPFSIARADGPCDQACSPIGGSDNCLPLGIRIKPAVAHLIDLYKAAKLGSSTTVASGCGRQINAVNGTLRSTGRKCSEWAGPLPLSNQPPPTDHNQGNWEFTELPATISGIIQSGKTVLTFAASPHSPKFGLQTNGKIVSGGVVLSIAEQVQNLPNPTPQLLIETPTMCYSVDLE